MTRYVRGAAGRLRGRAGLSCDRRAGEHVLRAQIPEAVPARARRPRADRRDPRSPARATAASTACARPGSSSSAHGVDVGRDRVARLMRQEGLEGMRRGKKKRTTIPDEAALERARDLLQRDFTATRPNEKWVADITYLRTWNGFVYLAFILDCYSRMIVGWQLATHLRTELVMDALEMANGLRRQPAA